MSNESCLRFEASLGDIAELNSSEMLSYFDCCQGACGRLFSAGDNPGVIATTTSIETSAL
jgi:hypothetical protein